MKSLSFFILLFGFWGGVLQAASLPAASSAPMPEALQQETANTIFRQIFLLSQEKKGPENALRRAALYRELIESCPATPLAQESYLHLTTLLLKDMEPPAAVEALQLLRRFKAQYPASPLRQAVRLNLEEELFRQQKWDLLLEVETICLQKTTAGGGEDAQPASPPSLYYYGEARFHRRELDAARPYYDAILACCPQSKLAKLAGKRLEEIASRQRQTSKEMVR